MVKQKTKDSSSDPTSHQTTDQTSGFSGRRGPAAARGFSPRTRPQPAAWPTLRVFLRSVCLSLQTPCKYFRNSAKCPQCAGISPGPGRPPVPGGTPSPVAGRGCRVLPSRRRAETDRDEAGAVPALPAGAAGRGGRCSPSGARAAGEGAPGPLRPTETAFLARPCLWRGRAAAGPQQELCLPPRWGLGAWGPPGEPHRPCGRAGLRLPPRCGSPATSRPARRAGPLPVPPGLSAQMSLLRIKKGAGRWEVGGQCFSPSSSHGGKSWQAEAACKSDGETALPLLFPVPSPPVPGVVRGARLKVRTCF